MRRISPKLRPDDPRHKNLRRKLRIVGPVVLAIGFISLVAAVADFVLSIGSMRVPYFFIIGGLGTLLIPFGLFLTTIGFAGAVARYQANEIAPVGRDAVNYLADGTQEGVRTIAGAVAGGIRDGLSGDNASSVQRFDCPQCAAVNDADAKFCDHCDAELIRQITCVACNATNDPEAHYCDHCGQPLD